jgi:hypothetical protein
MTFSAVFAAPTDSTNLRPIHPLLRTPGSYGKRTKANEVVKGDVGWFDCAICVVLPTQKTSPTLIQARNEGIYSFNLKQRFYS